MAYTFNKLASGNIDVLENGKSIYGAGTPGVSASYAKSLGYAAPAMPVAPSMAAPTMPSYSSAPTSVATPPPAPSYTNPNAAWQNMQAPTPVPQTGYTPPAPSYTPAAPSYSAPPAAAPKPTSGAGPSVTASLQPGSSGTQVKALQDWLVREGYMTQQQVNTGYGTYGPQTKAAVAAWQKGVGLQVSDPSQYGYFGPLSRAYFAGNGGGTPPNSTGNTTNMPAVPDLGSGAGNMPPTPQTGPVTTPSGAQVDPTTGQLIQGPPGSGGTPGQANAPATSPTGVPYTGAGTIDASQATDNELLQSILDAMKPTAGETDLQGQLANLEASRRTSFENVEKQPIAMSFITGQENAIDKRANNQVSNLQQHLATLQAQRLASVDASKFAFEAHKPVSLGTGTALVDPLSGKTIAGATTSAQDKQAMDTFYNLQQNYPDAGIVYDSSKSWQDNETSAQQKASSSPSFQAKNTQYAINPLTGEPTIISKMTGPNGWDTASGGTNLGAFSPPAASGGGQGGAPAASTGQSLDVGASGQSVAALQQWLISKGYNIPAGATGTYGEQTKAAVAAFQKAAGVDTSGGGIGTFGPRTRTAAASQGFTSAGAPAGSGSPPSPGKLDPSQLQPELRATLQNLGGVQFFDASKATAAQLPYLQRASQSTGIPMLAKEDANKIQESYAAVTGSTQLVQSIQSLVKNVIKAGSNASDQTKQLAYLSAVEKAPSLFNDNDAKQFISARNSVLSLITRAAGEKGTLTNQDVARIADALPNYGDNSELAAQKASNLKNVLESVYRGSVQAYLGSQSGGGGGSPAPSASAPAGAGTYQGYTLPH